MEDLLRKALDDGFRVDMARHRDLSRDAPQPGEPVYTIHLSRITDHGLVQGHGRDQDLTSALRQAIKDTGA